MADRAMHGLPRRFSASYPTRAQIDEFYAEQQEPNDYEMEHYINMREAKRQGWRDSPTNYATARRAGPFAGDRLRRGLAASGGARWGLAGRRHRGHAKFQKYASQTLKLPVQRGTIDFLKENRPAEPYDIIVMTDVIGHLQDPVGDLRTLRHSIADDGYLVVATWRHRQSGGAFLRPQVAPVRDVAHGLLDAPRSVAGDGARGISGREVFPKCATGIPIRRASAKAKAREVAKLAARAALFNGYVRRQSVSSHCENCPPCSRADAWITPT